MLWVSPTAFRWVAKSPTGDSAELWATGELSLFFSEAKVESMVANEILLELNADALHRALSSARDTPEVMMKLTKKKDQAYLSFSIECRDQRIGAMSVLQDVPVKVGSVDLCPVQPEMTNEQAVYILLPSLKALRPIIDHMKNIDNKHLYLACNMNGELTLKVETTLITVCAHFDKLTHPTIDGKPEPVRSRDVTATVKTEIKKFGKFLYCALVEPQNVVCCADDNQTLVLHALAPDNLALTYYLPNAHADTNQ